MRKRDRRAGVIEAIRSVMLERKMTMRGLSKALGKHHNYMREILEGQHEVRVDEFIEIAEALDMSAHDLLSRVLRP